MQPVTRVTLICAYEPCQTPFPVLPQRVGRAKYCSTRCKGLAEHQRQVETLADRFWSKVLKAGPDECWMWQGATMVKGYGVLSVAEQHRIVGAHIVSWYLHTGSWPPAEMDVLHNCPGGDRPGCVNYAHLWLGTPQANMLDKVAKERDRNQFGYVPLAQREEIVALYLTGTWTYDQLGVRYGLSAQTIYTYVRKHRNALPQNNTKVTLQQWEEALALWDTGQWTRHALAQHLGVSHARICQKLRQHNRS